MTTLLASRPVLGLSASAVLIATGAVPAQAAAAPGWRINATVEVPGGESALLGITAVSRADAWAVGFTAKGTADSVSPFIERWNGRAWRRAAVPAKIVKKVITSQPAAAIGASSRSSVWAVNEVSGGWLHWNGHRWSAGKLPAPAASGQAAHAELVITAVKVFSRKNAWAFGSYVTGLDTSDPKVVPYTAHFSGTRWRIAGAPGGIGSFTAISAISRSDIWGVLGSPYLLRNDLLPSANAVVHWNGHRWRSVALPSALTTQGNLVSVMAKSDRNVWIGGGTPNADGGTTETAAHWNGTAWKSASLAAAASTQMFQLSSMVRDGKGGIWGLSGISELGTWRFWHFTGGRWTGPILPRFNGRVVIITSQASVPRTASVWACGITVGQGSGEEGIIAVHGRVPR